jgi:hypothetical protein
MCQPTYAGAESTRHGQYALGGAARSSRLLVVWCSQGVGSADFSSLFPEHTFRRCRCQAPASQEEACATRRHGSRNLSRISGLAGRVILHKCAQMALATAKLRRASGGRRRSSMAKQTVQVRGPWPQILALEECRITTRSEYNQLSCVAAESDWLVSTLHFSRNCSKPRVG